VTYTLTVSDTLNDRLNRMAADHGGSPGDVLAKAIALLEVAMTARQQDCCLAVLDTDNRVQTKIEGL
jgi:predicted transcriptional regulator